MQDLDTEVWYKQFWPWFLIILPSTAVVACFYTLYIAITGADTLVNDNYYKEGLAINKQLAGDALAQQLDISAALRIDDVTGEVLVTLNTSTERPQHLQLELIHPVNEKADKSFQLRLAPTGDYIGQMPSNTKQRWYVQLTGLVKSEQANDAQQWRLKGEIDLNKSYELALAPSL
jgi:hypothetical protein